MAEITQDMLSALVQSGNLELSSSQTKLCVLIINRIYNQMLQGIDCGRIKVDNGTIIDGHHRYVASILAGVPIDTTATNSTSATIITAWEAVDFIFDEDWDNPDIIIRVNIEHVDPESVNVA